MAFEIYGAGQKESTNTKTVNFDDINKYVVETAGLQDRETLLGYVSMLVDVGTQEQPDTELVFVGSEEDEREETSKNQNTYFKDGFDQTSKKPVRLKCWPNKPVQCIAVAVDFPDIIIDKGSFFGESKPLPLRLWLGGQFYIQGQGMSVARPTPLKVNKKLGDWSLDQKNLFYKMAVAAKHIKPGDVYKPQRIDELLGMAFQFNAQVFFKESKGKQYYNEYIQFVSGLGRGQVEPELLTKPLMIQFNQQNEVDAVKELRAHVVNTIKKASNYDKSMIRKQIEEIRGVKPSEGGQETPVAQATAPKETVKASPSATPQPTFDEDFDDSSLPF